MTDKSLTERLRASPTSEIMMEAADHIDGLIAQHHRDSKELRHLCAARDEARQIALNRGFGLLKLQREARVLEAENQRLREALTELVETAKLYGLREDDYIIYQARTALAQEQGEKHDNQD